MIKKEKIIVTIVALFLMAIFPFVLWHSVPILRLVPIQYDLWKNCRNAASAPSFGFTLELNNTSYCILENEMNKGSHSFKIIAKKNLFPWFLVVNREHLITLNVFMRNLDDLPIPDNKEHFVNEAIATRKEQGNTQYKNKRGLTVVEFPGQVSPQAYITHPSKNTVAQIFLRQKSEKELFKEVVNSLATAQ